MDFVFNQTNQAYLPNIQLMNTQSKEIFYGKLTFVFLEMPEFVKSKEQLKTNADKWLYIFKTCINWIKCLKI